MSHDGGHVNDIRGHPDVHVPRDMAAQTLLAEHGHILSRAHRLRTVCHGARNGISGYQRGTFP
jgi:hypothetical protein